MWDEVSIWQPPAQITLPWFPNQERNCEILNTCSLTALATPRTRVQDVPCGEVAALMWKDKEGNSEAEKHGSHDTDSMSPPTAHYPARLIQLRLSVQMGTYRDLIFTLFFKWLLHDLIHTWHISPTPSLAFSEPQWGVYRRRSESREDRRCLKVYLFFFLFTHATHTPVKLFQPRRSRTLIISRSVFTLKSNPVKSKQHVNSVISVKAINTPLTQTHIPGPFCISLPQEEGKKTTHIF